MAVQSNTTHTPDNQNVITEDVVDQSNVVKRKVKVAQQRGYAPVESTLNTMLGEITYETLEAKTQRGEIHVSPDAMALKLKSDQISIFQRKDYTSLIDTEDPYISFENLILLRKFLSESGRIVPSRISDLSRTQQAEMEKAVKIARFLGLLPYVDYAGI